MNKKAEGQQAENDDTVVIDDENLEGAGGAGQGEGGNTQGQGGEAGAGEGQGGEGQGESDEVVVTIGEETPPTDDEQHAQAPEWVRELRKKNREDQKRIRELEERLSAATGAETKPVQLGAKPTLEACDYDAEKYEAELEQWYQRKRKVDEAAAQAEAERKAQDEAWQAKLSSYNKAKTELKVKDFDDAEGTVQEALSTTQQGIILQGAENPALVIYALGKNPKKAQELAAIKDPVKYAFAVAKLETQLKVTNRKAPPPERTVQGTGSKSGAVDSTLERLRAEAEKTGDYTKVTAYKRQKRQA